jgi:RimJ/RimL family protein N-acetyltransferase
MTELAAPMQGDGCSALLFSDEHRDALRSACAEDRDIWQIYSMDFGPEAFDTNIDALASRSDAHVFALFDGVELAGMSSFLGINPTRQTLEIGATYYRPHLRGSGLNRRVKDMMIGRAFESGFRRIEFRVDRRNGRPQAAMAKLGAVREGVFRADRITWNGHVRDTVLFAILKDEWPV